MVTMMRFMSGPTLVCTPATRRLCTLLTQWPRQAIVSWLRQQVSPLQALQSTAQPQVHAKRNKQVSAFAQEARLPAFFGSADFAAVGLFDESYPALLKNIPYPPLVLFCVGNLSALKDCCVAVVGARKCTTAGRTLANTMATELAASGLTIVSGLALGIDAAAHRGALSANAGRTVAVLGAGFAHLYPLHHRRLAMSILTAGGLLVSEYPSAMPPRPYQFPERNRLISGLSELTLLVEAGEQGGSLITARLALQQGRDVCAVPGSALSPQSAGCHRLIRQGAALVTNAQEVAEEMGWELAPQPSQLAASDSAALELGTGATAVLAVLGAEPRQLDEISVLAALDPQQVSQSLVELQLCGFVRYGPDGYIRVL